MIVALISAAASSADVRKGEETRLHHGVDPTAELGLLFRDLVGVDDPEPDVLVLQLALHLGGQAVPDLLGSVRAVEQEGGAVSCHIEDIDATEQPELMAGDEVGIAHEVGRIDRARGPNRRCEAVMAPGRLGVVHEVALHELVGCLHDDLGAVLVGADGAV